MTLSLSLSSESEYGVNLLSVPAKSAINPSVFVWPN